MGIGLLISRFTLPYQIFVRLSAESYATQNNDGNSCRRGSGIDARWRRIPPQFNHINNKKNNNMNNHVISGGFKSIRKRMYKLYIE